MGDRSRSSDVVRELVQAGGGRGKGRALLGEPIERGSVTLLPVLSRRGSVRGAYVITSDNARWEPAFNLNRAILVGNIGWWATLAFAWWFVRQRRKEREAAAAGSNSRATDSNAGASDFNATTAGSNT